MNLHVRGVIIARLRHVFQRNLVIALFVIHHADFVMRFGAGGVKLQTLPEMLQRKQPVALCIGVKPFEIKALYLFVHYCLLSFFFTLFRLIA